MERGLAWTAQSMGQIKAAKAIIDAEEQGNPQKRSRNMRNKKVIERSKAVSKAFVEGIKQNGGIFAAFSKAGENMKVALKCPEEYRTLLREHTLIDLEDWVALETAKAALGECDFFENELCARCR